MSFWAGLRCNWDPYSISSAFAIVFSIGVAVFSFGLALPPDGKFVLVLKPEIYVLKTKNTTFGTDFGPEAQDISIQGRFAMVFSGWARVFTIRSRCVTIRPRFAHDLSAIFQKITCFMTKNV